MLEIVNKLWGFWNTLRHDGIDYGDYIEQLTSLLLLKMADERGVLLPENYNWDSLKILSGIDFLDHYQDTLRKLRISGFFLARHLFLLRLQKRKN